jgi:hypothetical protein
MLRGILWAARVFDAGLLLLLALFVAGEGLPSPSRLMAIEKLSFLAHFLILAGLLLAWKWPGWGGATVACGWLFYLVVSGSRSAFMPVPALFGIVGLMFLVVWWGSGRSAARPMALAAGAVLLPVVAGWFWSGAGARDLQIRTADASSLAGRWHGTASVSDTLVTGRAIPIEIVIGADGAFSGRVGQGRITRGSVARHLQGRVGYLLHKLGEPPFTMHLELDVPATETPRLSSPEAIISFDPLGDRLNGAIHLLDTPEDLRDLHLTLVRG